MPSNLQSNCAIRLVVELCITDGEKRLKPRAEKPQQRRALLGALLNGHKYNKIPGILADIQARSNASDSQMLAAMTTISESIAADCKKFETTAHVPTRGVAPAGRGRDPRGNFAPKRVTEGMYMAHRLQ